MREIDRDLQTCGNERLLFLHTPKTAGHWVKHAMLAAGVELRIEARAHARLADVDRRGRFTFAFVRKPFDWYGSWWSYVRTGNRQLWAFLSAYPLDKFSVMPFPRFLESVVRWHPGWLSREFSAYIGQPDSEIEFVGRYENLEDDLVRALTLAGQDFDEEVLRALPPINTSSPPPPCPEDTRQALVASEQAAYTRFYQMTTHARSGAGAQAGGRFSIQA